MSKLALALQMEIDGEQYYLQQAEKNKGNAMQRAFQMLAAAENKHAHLLRSKMNADDSSWAEELHTDEPANLFTGKADFHRDAGVVPGQLEVYVTALDMEQKSIDLYQDTMAGAKDELTRQLLAFLISQEKGHYALFDELTALLRNPRDWVEAAEFGPRAEY